MEYEVQNNTGESRMSSHSGERDIESIPNESDIDIRGRTFNGKPLFVPGN